MKATLGNRRKDWNQSPAGGNSTSSKGKDTISASKGESAPQEVKKMEKKREMASSLQCAKTFTEMADGQSRKILRDGQADKYMSPDCSIGEVAGTKTVKEGKVSHSGIDPLSLELVKKSDKCVKDLHQALTSLIHNVDHILKSTQSMNAVEKDLT